MAQLCSVLQVLCVWDNRAAGEYMVHFLQLKPKRPPGRTAGVPTTTRTAGPLAVALSRWPSNGFYRGVLCGLYPTNPKERDVVSPALNRLMAALSLKQLNDTKTRKRAKSGEVRCPVFSGI
jgi:hypothetical protein